MPIRRLSHGPFVWSLLLCVRMFLTLCSSNSIVKYVYEVYHPRPQFPASLHPEVRRNRMKQSFLRQINKSVDWRGIRTLLNKKYTKTQNAVGNSAYDALMMFKILLLQIWSGPKWLWGWEAYQWVHSLQRIPQLGYGYARSGSQHHQPLPLRAHRFGDYGQTPRKNWISSSRSRGLAALIMVRS